MMGPNGEGFESEAIAAAPYVALGESVERRWIGAMTTADRQSERRAGRGSFMFAPEGVLLF